MGITCISNSFLSVLSYVQNTRQTIQDKIDDALLFNLEEKKLSLNNPVSQP